ncbi:semaphorin-2A-like isoform X2 [Orbicella faveolata]|uniref:semaphorin-2A-like isoform X2 n=1 Tax=Orbicella faveolata TaxID=48498 RepID=UPI0009E45226|nr:semaphorin-2A-like isoform X2 [Orbicella faveolata]
MGIMHKVMVILSLGVLSCFLCCKLCSGEAVLSYTNCRDCVRFCSNGSLASHVERILVDELNGRLIVGATNSLFKLELTTLQLLSAQNDVVALLPSQEALQTCLKLGLTRDSCQNHIKLLLFSPQGLIFVCGTYAETPRCWKFPRTSSLNPPPAGKTGDGISPSSDQQNVTGTFTSNHLFTGINIGRSVIYRWVAADLSSRTLLQTDSSPNVYVLKDADFVSSFNYTDNFVYFFLRETAAETSKTVYSRVARVCQYDEGGNRLLVNRFTSFVKTRILCSVPGTIPFDYNEIQATATYQDPVTNEDYVYGIFTTPKLGVLGSAVCRYSMKSVKKLFETSQYLKETTKKGFDGTSLWVSVSPINLTMVPGRPKCDSKLNTKSYSWETLKFASEHTLLADPLTSDPLFKARKPLFTRPEIRFTRLVVDKAKRGKIQVTPVMFISIENGTVFKVFNNISGNGNPVIVEQIRVFEKPNPVYTMKLYKGAVYIGSNSSVVKLPVEHCSQYQSCRTCVSVLDPYCGWSNNKCTTFDSKIGSGWAQDIVHGNFSKVCPQEPPTCSLTVTEEQVGGVRSLTCLGDGIPLPRVTSWKKDSKPLPTDLDLQIKPGKRAHQEQLVINNFGMEHLGVYECLVSNKLGLSSCAMNIRGTLPVIAYALVKINGTSLFVCNATGLPSPHVTVYKVIGGTKHVVTSYQTPISDDTGQRSYYCVAQNDFGVSFSKQVHIHDKQVKAELRLTKEKWSSKLYDKTSDEYKTLAARVKTSVQEIYSTNPAFVRVEDISFSEGSVVCKMTLIFAAAPLTKSDELLKDLQENVSSGKVGAFSVDSAHILNLEPEVEPTPEPDVQDSRDDGLFAVAVVTAVLLSLILGVVLGLKFHGQVVNRCTPSSRDPESCDGPNKTVEGVKYTKSPPRDEKFTRNKNETRSKRKLLKKKGKNAGETEDSDSDSSTAGKIGQEESGNQKDSSTSSSPTKSISPSVVIGKFARKKPSLENGKISNVC